MVNLVQCEARVALQSDRQRYNGQIYFMTKYHFRTTRRLFYQGNDTIYTWVKMST